MNVTIEPASLDDADAIRGLEGLTPASARLLERDLAGEDRCCLLARPVRDGAGCAGEVVGYAAAACHLEDAEILDVAVASAWRRRGVATQLVGELLRVVRSRGANAATLEVRETNAAALALYRHLGFTVEGRRPGYYPDGEAALIMWRRG